MENVFCTVKWIFTTILLQGTDTDFFRSMGKINVVFAVIMVIFIGIVVYLFRIDKRLKGLEKRLKQ
jgi:CcmD family protein